MIEIINRQSKYHIRLRRFRRLLLDLGRRNARKNAEVTLAFVGTKTITRLNKTFLKKNKPTDVLSFPIGETGSDGKFYLGDIIVCVPAAFKQCFAKEHGLERELEILVIHGFNHLLGLGHGRGIEEKDKKARKALLKD